MSENNEDPVYVNNVAVSGFVNGVINVAFVTYRFLPQVIEEEEGARMIVAEAPKIMANLRFDLLCAQELHRRLSELIEENTKPAPKVAN